MKISISVYYLLNCERSIVYECHHFLSYQGCCLNEIVTCYYSCQGSFCIFAGADQGGGRFLGVRNPPPPPPGAPPFGGPPNFIKRGKTLHARAHICHVLVLNSSSSPSYIYTCQGRRYPSMSTTNVDKEIVAIDILHSHLITITCSVERSFLCKRCSQTFIRPNSSVYALPKEKKKMPD